MTPSPVSEAGEEIRAPSLARVEEPPEGTLNLGKRPMMSSSMVGRSARNKGTQADPDNEVEEIQGSPHDGRQHFYVWHQRGDHWAGHKEITEVEEAEMVERAAKLLVNKVKVSDLAFLEDTQA